MEALLDLKHQENHKKLKSFLVAIQYMALLFVQLSERCDWLRKLLKKNTEWKWETEQENHLKTMKKMFIEEPSLAQNEKH